MPLSKTFKLGFKKKNTVDHLQPKLPGESLQLSTYGSGTAY